MEIISFDKHFDIDVNEIDGDVYIGSFSVEPSEAFVNALRSSLKIDQRYESLSFGQLILIENIINNVKDTREMIPMILSIFYRPVEEKIFDNEDSESEKLKVESFKDFPVGAAFLLYNRLLERRDSFINDRYEGIIYGKKSDGDSKPNDNIETRFNKVFFWYERQRSIAKELNMKMSDVLNMTADEALFELAYQTNKVKLEEFRRKQEKSKL